MRRSVHDAGWGTFLRVLADKAVEHDRQLVVAGRFEPTSQVCSVCGVQDGPKPLSVRFWTCAGCDTRLDRDFNAAVNVLLAAGLAESLTHVEGTSDARLRAQPPSKQEPAERT